MEDEQQQVELPEFGEIKALVRRRRWEFLLPFFLGWLLIWGGGWLVHSTYRSGTLILVEQPPAAEKYLATNGEPTDVQQQLDNITEQILSRTHLLHIIDTLGLYNKQKNHLSDDDMVERMRKDIEVELVKGDDKRLSAFNIYYNSRDPKVAQAVTSQLADLFIEENLEQRQKQSEDTTSFLEDQLEQARQKLAQQEAKMRDFKDRHIGELPTQTQSNLQILTGLQNQERSAEDALSRARQQNTYLQSLLSQYQTIDRGAKASDEDTGGLAAVDKELEQLKTKLADLTAHYTDKHPDVKKTKEQIAHATKVREKLLADMNQASSAPDTENWVPSGPDSRSILELEGQLKANQVEITSREAEIKDVQAKLAEYQGRLNMAPVMEQQFADITRDYDQSKADYESLLKKKNESSMATDLERTQQSQHFRMMDPPNLPSKPAKPNRLLFCVAGLAVGLVMGSGVVAAREKLSGKVYSEREIKKLVPFAVIVEIPPIETPEEERSNRRGMWLAGAAALAVAACVLVGSAVTYLYG
jgi:polysaccharide chain length determinant protein (PEP-CTERM system associated)